MATLTSVTPGAATSPLARWHLLSLDAPSIAALWTWFVAWSSHMPLPLLSPVAMFLAVWTLYAADRLLDARPLAFASRTNPPMLPPRVLDGDLEARHHFHAQHRAGFLRSICLACFALGLLLPSLPPATLRLDGLLGAILAGYFIVIHATSAARRLPKEIAVGIFFAAAVFIPTIAQTPALCRSLLPSSLLFAALCSLNCLYIYGWEHRQTNLSPRPARGRLRAASGSTEPHLITRHALAHLHLLNITLFSLALLVALLQQQPTAFAVALAAGALLALDRLQPRIARVDLRAAADLALATPLVAAPLLTAVRHLHL